MNTDYLYGDEGHDVIFGADNNSFEYIWGGSGDDEIDGGDSIDMASVLNGNEGNDTVMPGNNLANTATLEVNLGKGDDKFNTVGVADDYNNIRGSAQGAVKVSGMEGDDEINAMNGGTAAAEYFGG